MTHPARSVAVSSEARGARLRSFAGGVLAKDGSVFRRASLARSAPGDERERGEHVGEMATSSCNVAGTCGELGAHARIAADGAGESNGRRGERAIIFSSVAGSVCKEDERSGDLAKSSRQIANTARSAAGGVCKQTELLGERASLLRNDAGEF